MKLVEGYLDKGGYRLPTDAEWEFACRSGTATIRFFGTDDRLVEKYAWYSDNSRLQSDSVSNDSAAPRHSGPVGSLKPNPFGLFDIYGNVYEWVEDREIWTAKPPKVDCDVEDNMLEVLDEDTRSRRGGSFNGVVWKITSSNRAPRAPKQENDINGFRVARTILCPPREAKCP
jgi:formylglycine-generating enzyme required for sulfatase activity